MTLPPRRYDLDELIAWCQAQRPGAQRAVFLPGEPLRCPGTAQTVDGRRGVCGRLLGTRAKPQTRVIVRVIRPNPPRIDAAGLESDEPCPHCGARLEQYVTPYLPLEAAG